jgi:hypothetical protein
VDRYEAAIKLLAQRFGEEEVEGIDAVLPHKVFDLADRLKAVQAEEQNILDALRERIRQAAKPRPEEISEVREASLMS